MFPVVFFLTEYIPLSRKKAPTQQLQISAKLGLL